MKKTLKQFLILVSLVFGLGLLTSALIAGATTVCFPSQGCTGTSTTPTAQQILVGTSSGAYVFATANTANGPVFTDGSNSLNGTFIQFKAASTSLSSVVLSEGQIGYATNTKSTFIGDGTTAGGNPVGFWRLGTTTVASTSLSYTGARVGIGTTNPSTKLDIQTRVLNEGIINAQNPVSGGQFNIDSTGNEFLTGGIVANGSSDFAGLVSGGNSFQISDGPSGDPDFSVTGDTDSQNLNITIGNPNNQYPNLSLFRAIADTLSSNVSVFDQTKVGIGTSSPAALLGVAGGGYFGGNLTATGTITAGTLLKLGGTPIADPSNIYYPEGTGTKLADTTGALYYGNPGNNIALVDSGGNIYYSTGSKLTDTSGNLYIPSLPHSVLATDNSGKIIATTTSGGGSGTVNSGNTGQIPFYAATSTTLTATSTIFLKNGFIGINTTIPQALVDIQGTTGTLFQVKNIGTPEFRIFSNGNVSNGGTIEAGQGLQNDSGPVSFQDGPSGDNIFTITGDTDNTNIDVNVGDQTDGYANMELNPAGNVLFNVPSTLNNYTFSTGKVGIGTSTPDSSLDVGGNVKFEGKSSFVTTAIGGAIISGGCDTVTTTGLDTTMSSSTSFVTTPQADPGTTLGGTWAYSYLSGSGQVTTRVCANVSVTPNSVKYTVKIIK